MQMMRCDTTCLENTGAQGQVRGRQRLWPQWPLFSLSPDWYNYSMQLKYFQQRNAFSFKPKCQIPINFQLKIIPHIDVTQWRHQGGGGHGGKCPPPQSEVLPPPHLPPSQKKKMVKISHFWQIFEFLPPQKCILSPRCPPTKKISGAATDVTSSSVRQMNEISSDILV